MKPEVIRAREDEPIEEIRARVAADPPRLDAFLTVVIVDRPRQAPVFYVPYAAVTLVSVAIVLLPGAALVPILFLSPQVLNAILLLPLMMLILGVARDRSLMGNLVISRGTSVMAILCIALVAVCVAALGILAVA
jgi:Mn2+/Fe2+ NRAMP family transporter